MKKYIATILSLLFLWTHSFSQENNMSPKIVKTIPEYGDCQVNSELKEIVVIFNEDMQGGMSVVDSRDMPQITDKPFWKDKRTFVIPVNLTADKLYYLIFNNQKFTNFRNIDGIPLQPDELFFKTETVNYERLNTKAYEELFTYFPNYYSYSDLKGINWKQEFEKRKNEFINSNSDIEFAINLLSVLKQANDPHMYIEVKGERYYSGRTRITTPNYIRANSIFRLLEDQVTAAHFSFSGGRIGDVGYVYIKNWNFDIENLEVRLWGHNDSTITIRDFLNGFNSLENLIIDVRENTGGNEAYAKQFASFFTNKKLAYEKIVVRDSVTNKFEIEREKYLYPNNKPLNFKGNIYVLSGPAVMSSNESFLLMMKQIENVKIAGMKSYGSTANPKPVELSNYIKIFIPSWQAFTLDGKLIEGNGIEPDIEIISEHNNALTKDFMKNKQEDLLLNKIIEITKKDNPSQSNKQDVAPPKIISTSPVFGAIVDSNLKEIVIKFDQNMESGMSVVNTEHFPKISEKPKWIDKKTIFIPVELEPNKEYWLTFNSEKYTNFKSVSGISLDSWQLRFKTK
ncbi:MAG: S41 family peptidase [Salinivirgaceae bacterium]|nr:S41 family peptidase [Salinivirgaceae bacterium]